MNTRKPERQILRLSLFRICSALPGLSCCSVSTDLLHNAMQDRLFGVLHTFPEAQNRIESEAESHV